jgi:uncharacterized protein
MKPFSLLIKPGSADCNLNCTYCFYRNPPVGGKGDHSRRMSGKILEQVISSYMRTNQPHHIFSWQGGEPTLMGIDFFQWAVTLQEKYGKGGSLVSNGIQTNGILIDDRWAVFFEKYKFLVGVSLDGPQYIHDVYRKYKNGSGSYKDVIKSIECLKRNNAEFNILTLVNSANVTKGKEVYRFLCENGLFYHQYIPCVEFDREGNALPYSITAEKWGDFLCEIYDEWIKTGVHEVSIRLFDSILVYLVTRQYTICSMAGECSQYFVVEFNGDIYPCDFFVRKDLKIGSIDGGDWRHFRKSPVYTNFAHQKSKWNNKCSRCKYNLFCSGDCLKNRFYIKKNPTQLSWLCKGWKAFFNHALPGFREIAKKI